MPWSLALAESERAVVSLQSVRSYPEGLTFEIDIQFIDDSPPPGPDDSPPRNLEPRDVDEVVHVSVVFSDGPAASNEDRWDRRSVPDSPVLVTEGGSGHFGQHERHYTIEGWLWPLPPPGDLVWVVQAHTIGLARTETIVDADVARTASTAARRVLNVRPPGSQSQGTSGGP